MTCKRCEAPIDDNASAAFKELALRPLVYGLCAYMFTKIPLHNRLSFLGFNSPTSAVVSAAVVAGAVEGGLGYSATQRSGKRMPDAARLLFTIPTALIALPITTLIVQRSLSLGILKDLPRIGMTSVGCVATFPVIGASIAGAHYLWANPNSKLSEYRGEDEPLKQCYNCETKWDRHPVAALKILLGAVVSSIVLPFVLRKAIPSVPGKVWMAGALFSPIASLQKAYTRIEKGRSPEKVHPDQALGNLLGVTLSTLSVYLITRKWGPRLDFKGAMGVGLLGYVGARAIDWTITGAIDNAYNAWPHPPKQPEGGSSFGGLFGRPSGSSDSHASIERSDED